MKYSWDKKVFEELIKSISKKMDASKKYYRMGGMPLVLQVWLNIVSNPRELSILQLPSPFVEPRSVSPVANAADDSNDDFINDPTDYGLFVDAYSEFLSGGEDIPNVSIDVELLRNRYVSILWDFGMKKIEVDAMSDDEAPPRKIRPIVECSSSVRIILF
ncbi:hypothetical protein HAX54_004137 [Datura stramonium]|uniref:Uncharacterized protein n=1 Tax=Datura stramonium TaxID=4076 RepID=A0ABS8WVQ0_DATST|nr:hypothetical protein [Datura stramonium]